MNNEVRVITNGHYVFFMFAQEITIRVRDKL